MIVNSTSITRSASAATAATSSSSSQALSGTKGLGKDDFLKLLIAQMKNQDPMNPTQDKEFIAEMAQFQSLESMKSVDTGIKALLDMQQLSQASSLIGKTVTATNSSDGSAISGRVSEVTLQSGVAILKIGDTHVPLQNVTKVTA